tara:strand:+ start:114 stop:1979 length:1866 start_codon:yes stop_codon:yes gene_type:complete
MAVIYTYPQTTDLQNNDLFLVSKMDEEGRPTRSVSAANLANFIAPFVPVSGGTVTGTGTTDTLPIWTDGPNGVLGDSITLQKSSTSYDASKLIEVGGPISQINLGFSNYIGINAGTNDTNPGTAGFTGNYNVGIGTNALGLFTTGELLGVLEAGENVAVGFNALKNLTKGTNNIAIGANTAPKMLDERNNIAIGKNALLITGGGGSATDVNNIAVGLNALHNQERSYNNVVIGNSAFEDTVTDQLIIYDTVAIGQKAGTLTATTGFIANCVFVGANAGSNLLNSTSISNSVFVGFDAGRGLGRAGNTSGADIGIGNKAFYGSSGNFSSVGNNIAIGNGANGNNSTTDIEGSIAIGSAGSSKADSFAICISEVSNAIINESKGQNGVIIGGFGNLQNAPQGGIFAGQGNTIDVTSTNSVIIGGVDNSVVGANGFTLGQGLNANANQTVVGKYNIALGNGKFVVGIGTSDAARDNAFEVLNTGKLRARQYGAGTFADTAVYGLGVKGNGEIIESAIGSLTSQTRTFANGDSVFLGATVKQVYLASSNGFSSPGSADLTLPNPSVFAGRQLTILLDASWITGTTLVLTASGGGNIGSSPSITLSQYSSVSVFCDGTLYYVISKM